VGLPDGISCIRRSAAVLYIHRRKYVSSLTVSVQVKLNRCRVCVCQQSDAADRGIGVIPIYVQRVNNEFEKSDDLLYVLQSNAARRVESEYDV